MPKHLDVFFSFPLLLFVTTYVCKMYFLCEIFYQGNRPILVFLHEPSSEQIPPLSWFDFYPNSAPSWINQSINQSINSAPSWIWRQLWGSRSSDDSGGFIISRSSSSCEMVVEGFATNHNLFRLLTWSCSGTIVPADWLHAVATALFRWPSNHISVESGLWFPFEITSNSTIMQ